MYFHNATFTKFQVSALHYAARQNSLLIMQMILEHGAEVDILASGDLTPLHFAARFKINQESGDGVRVVSTYKPAIKEVMENKDEADQVDPAIHLLVTYGANVNKKDRCSYRNNHLSSSGPGSGQYNFLF